MSEKFTVEEVNLIHIFDTSSRCTLVSELTDALAFFEDEELIEIAGNVLDKLEDMSDLEFAAFDAYPEYEDMEA